MTAIPSSNDHPPNITCKKKNLNQPVKISIFSYKALQHVKDGTAYDTRTTNSELPLPPHISP